MRRKRLPAQAPAEGAPWRQRPTEASPSAGTAPDESASSSGRRPVCYFLAGLPTLTGSSRRASIASAAASSACSCRGMARPARSKASASAAA